MRFNRVKSIPVSCPHTLGSQDQLSLSLMMHLFCPFVFGRSLACNLLIVSTRLKFRSSKMLPQRALVNQIATHQLLQPLLGLCFPGASLRACDVSWGVCTFEGFKGPSRASWLSLRVFKCPLDQSMTPQKISHNFLKGVSLSLRRKSPQCPYRLLRRARWSLFPGAWDWSCGRFEGSQRPFPGGIN